MHTQLLFFNLGGPEILLIALVILLLFGGKKIPELMKGLGKGVKSFKDGMNGIEESIKESGDECEQAKSSKMETPASDHRTNISAHESVNKEDKHIHDDSSINEL